MKKLGQEWSPHDNHLPAIRLSVAPDGKSLIYPIVKRQTDIWMLQGYRQPGHWNQIRYFKR